MKLVTVASETPPRRALREGRRRNTLTALAIHPQGLTSRQVAEQYGESTGQSVLTRYGTALRSLRDAGYVATAGTIPSGPQRTLAIVYQITKAGREFLAASTAPRPAPPKRQRPEYPWLEEAIRRNHAGESLYALGQAYEVDPTTIRRAFERRGVPVRRHVGHPHRRPQPEWAAEAARRYRDGETRLALSIAYDVSDRKMARVLQAEGVTFRSKCEVRRLVAAARYQGQAPGTQPVDPVSS